MATTMAFMVDAPMPQAIEDELATVIENAERWLNAPNEHFAGRKPRDLIGTADERQLRDLVESIKHGAIS